MSKYVETTCHVCGRKIKVRLEPVVRKYILSPHGEPQCSGSGQIASKPPREQKRFAH